MANFSFKHSFDNLLLFGDGRNALVGASPDRDLLAHLLVLGLARTQKASRIRKQQSILEKRARVYENSSHEHVRGKIGKIDASIVDNLLANVN